MGKINAMRAKEKRKKTSGGELWCEMKKKHNEIVISFATLMFQRFALIEDWNQECDLRSFCI